jgi:hypothetical protein
MLTLIVGDVGSKELALTVPFISEQYNSDSWAFARRVDGASGDFF